MKAWNRTGFISRWCNAVLEDLRALTPLTSATIRPERIPGQGVMFHAVRGPGSVAEEKEWSVTIVPWDEKAIVEAGVIPFGSTRLGDAGEQQVTLDITAVPASSSRWIFAEVSFIEGTATAKVTADANKAVSDPNASIVRRNLIKVSRAADVDGVHQPVYRDGPIAHEGEIHFEGVTGL